MSINLSVLMGRITHTPELRHTKYGTPVCNFCIAANLGFGESKRTSYIDCVAWRKQAEFVAKYFDKGKPIALSGYIQTGSYEDKSGAKRKTVTVVAENISFVGDKNNSRPDGEGIDLEMDDLPWQ